MESLHISSGFASPSVPKQELLISRQFRGQGIRDSHGRRLRISGKGAATRRIFVSAMRGDGDEGNSRPLEVGREKPSEGAKRRPIWQKAWEYGFKRLGFGEEWEEDPRGQRELEELDLFLDGRGDLQWKDVLEPSVENVLAVVLTGLFLYAAALIGWQLLLVAAAITLSGLKYAVIAAVVLGVLIFFI
uniref:Uncharacterized protein n=2 Tax=Physcomitrium patens TaxID=3218 RepID=A0A7I4ERD7_PHYPA